MTERTETRRRRSGGRSASAEEKKTSRFMFSDGPHQMEQNVQRQLLAHPELRFSSLVIRRVPNGVCLEGILEANDDSPDVSSVVQNVVGVEEVLNHLVIRRLPAKG